MENSYYQFLTKKPKADNCYNNHSFQFSVKTLIFWQKEINVREEQRYLTAYSEDKQSKYTHT